jgi:hypothetical protein
LRHLKLTLKKSLHAAEQDRPDVAAERRALRTREPRLDSKKLVFIDETSVGTSITRVYGRAPRGERLVQSMATGQPRYRCASLRPSDWPFVLEGAMNGETFIDKFISK